MAFPPTPVYPDAIDSDYTLYLVFNTTETRLCKDNSPWADEIEIVAASGDEIWADNGFGNIEGELFYYDSVDKNSDGKVYRLKGCVRQLTGKTKFNAKGTWVRGYVVAEHHNQLVNTVLNIENFVGYNFDPRMETLDWRIRNLRALKVIFDDFNCPDIDFTFNVIDEDVESGILTEYTITVTPPGSIDSFRLDFGDGEFTTTALSGQHRYALNAVIDPVVTVSNSKCQITQTPIERANPAEPPIINQGVFDIPIPESPEVPDFTFVPCEVPEPDINLPPIVFPCLSLEAGSIPSVIIGPSIQMQSQVIIIGPQNPVNITQSVVRIEGDINIPSIIFVDIPPTIVIDPPIPPTIVIVPGSSITVGLDVGDLPKLEVDWGTPPAMEVALTMARDVRNPRMFGADPGLRNEFGEEFADLFEASEQIRVEYEPVGIPSEIKIIAPDVPIMKIDSSDIPRRIMVDTQDAHIPENIRVLLDQPIPTLITVDSDIPSVIEVVNKGLPSQIEVISDLPRKIEVEVTKDIPPRIVVEMPEPIPDRIIVDASGMPTTIQVVGFPDAIPVVGFPDGIKLLPPDEMPQAELVYKGSPIPIEVKVTMAEMLPSAEDGKTNCVMITPCPR